MPPRLLLCGALLLACGADPMQPPSGTPEPDDTGGSTGTSTGAGAPAGIIDDRPTLAELEQRYIALVLAECGGNKKKAAERLGIDRRTLYRALERSGEATDDDGDAA